MKKSNITIFKKSIISTILLFVLFTISSFAQTSLEGKLTDAASGDPLLFATIALYKNEVLIVGTETDLDGNYFFIDIDPGTYDLEANYIGYSSQRQVGVIIKAGRTNRLDFAISEGILMDAVEIVEYKMPLIEIDYTTSGSTVTAEAIRALPKKNINSIAATTAGSSPTNNGTISIRGSRSDATLYYVDGVRVSGSKNTSPHKPISSHEEYNTFIENAPKSPFRDPLSTFSIDVDRASYSNVRRMVDNGQLPPVDAVRIEEMINYFNYDYPTPKKKDMPFEVFTQLTECPWNTQNQILHIGVQGRKVKTENLPKSNLVFLIDVSGSMNSRQKLPLVKESFKLLLDQLRPDDRVAIVTYAGKAGVALPSTKASDKRKIISAIDKLGARGSTAGAEGIRTAYNIARANFMQDGNNRVILATDGDFNIGISSNSELDKLIERERVSGIFLSVLGYGMGNYKDGKMQSLADKGNGNHAYIDNIKEAKKVLVEEFGGTLFTIAKDVKIQIEFNPAYVGSYRLIGYENRILNAEDFKDDTKDAGELGSGHSVTALYEIMPNNGESTSASDDLKYQGISMDLQDNEELATIKLRYKTPDGHKSKELEKTINSTPKPLDEIEDRTKYAVAVAEFGMLLRKSKYSGDASYVSVEDALHTIDKNKYLTKDLLDLVSKAKELDVVK